MTISRRLALALLASFSLASPSIAQAQEKVVMASWGGGGATMIRRAFAEPFTGATNIPFDIVEVPDPTAAIAAAKGQPGFNVAVAASFQAASLAKRGLIEELTAEDLPEIKNIPERYWLKSDSGKFVGIPVYFIYYGIAFNTDLAKQGDFASWRSLADPKWKDKVSITRPIFSAPYDLTVFAKLNGGDETNTKPGIPMFKAVAANAINVYTSMASFQSQLSRGEVAAAPYYSSQIMLMKRAGVKNVDIVLPKEFGLALSYVYVIPKGAQNIAAAKRFLNSVVAKDRQIEAARHGSLPLNPDAKLPPDLEKEFGFTLAEVMDRTYSPNWNLIGSDLDARLKLVEGIIDEAR